MVAAFEIAIDPSGRFVYVTQFSQDQVVLLTVDPNTGELTTGGSVSVTGSSPALIVTTPYPAPSRETAAFPTPERAVLFGVTTISAGF